MDSWLPWVGFWILMVSLILLFLRGARGRYDRE